MIRSSSNNRRTFYVVQFIELPFEGIDDYVCVPQSWLIVRRETDQKAVVAYPKDEDPFETRDRARRRETYGDKWRFYMAVVKYESEMYRDAEFWIATRNDYGPLVQEESEIPDTQLRFTLNRKLRSATQIHLSKSNDNPRKPLPRISIKRPALSEPKKQLDVKRFKLDKAAHLSSAVINDANAEPGCSNLQQSIFIKNIQSIECAQTQKTAAASYGESSTPQRTDENLQESLPIQKHQELNMPLLDDDTPTVVIDDDEVQPTSIMERQRFSIKVLSQLAEQPILVQEPQISVTPPREMTRNNQELRSTDKVLQTNTISRFSRNNWREFYVVQFLELPHEYIDDYVCVPSTWLIVLKARDQKALIAYPKHEDPFDTRDRVMRKERYGEEWRYYMATVKYESDSYRDAEYWIGSRNDYRPLVQEESKITDAQPRFTLNKKIRSATQIHLSKSNDNPLQPILVQEPQISETPPREMTRNNQELRSTDNVLQTNTISRFSRNNWRKFYVVQFLELPHEYIDDYVCVPSTWLIVLKARDQKALIAYPKHEDPFVTRDRVKRKETYCEEWRYYMATVKYESDSYGDAEYWIGSRNDYRPLVQEESKITDAQPRFTLNKKIRSATQIHLSKSNDNPLQPILVQEPQISVTPPREMTRNNQELRTDNMLQTNTISRFSRNNRREFYVVQFLELPHEYIDDYVCVPSTWLIVLRAKDQKALIAYPKHEDPFVTRDRVKRKERYCEEWRFYMATVKCGSDSYRNAEYWIGSRNDYRPLVQKESKMTDAQPRFTLNKKMRSVNQSHSSKSNGNRRKLRLDITFKRPAQSKLKDQLDGNQLNLDKAAQLTSTDANDANAESGCSKREQSFIINQSHSSKSNDNPRKLVLRISFKRPSQTKNLLDGKRLKLDKPAQLSGPVVNDANAEPDEEQSIIIQYNPLMECAQTEEIAADSNGESSSAQRKDENLRQSLPMQEACHDQELRTSDFVNNEPTYHHLLPSRKMSDNLYSQMNGGRRLVPTQKPVEKIIRPMLPLPRRTQRI